MIENFDIKLDCPLGNVAAVATHKSAVAAAMMLYNSYIAAQDVLIGIGPELYAEQWIFNFIVFSSEEFDDLVLIYFIKILQGAQNG